jgi:hypothetical protein
MPSVAPTPQPTVPALNQDSANDQVAPFALAIEALSQDDTIIALPITSYNSINTAGQGIVPIYATATTTSTSTSQSNLISYTPPATAGTYRVSATIATTSGTNSGTTTVTITFHDAAGTTITMLPPFMQSASATLLTATTGVSKSFSMLPYTFTIDNSATAITVSTTVSGTVAAYISTTLEQLI